MEDDLFDETIWTPPDSLPDLSGEKLICIDVETKDPNLISKGPGWSRDDGYLIGIAVATENWQAYLPIAHDSFGNMSKTNVVKWLKAQLNHGMDVVFHNAQYDLGWLKTEGLEVKGNILDTMIAAPLLDENRFSYSLDALGKTYLGKRKQEDDLRRTAAQHGVDAKKDMWKLPPARVALYAETDARLTFDLWHVLKRKLKDEDCLDILKMELDLLPLIFDMKCRGVRVDLDKAHDTKKLLQSKEDALCKVIKNETGVDIEPWNAKSLARIFDHYNLSYDRTEKTEEPSFTKKFLSEHEHPVAKNILEIREYNKANTTFVDTILSHQHNGRIHCQFNQLRSDGGGTVSGRFSSSHPNLQQVPSRHPQIKKMVRGLFLPEEGAKWGSFDYSSQEPRWLMHYASLTPPMSGDEKVIEIVDMYHAKDVDFRKIMAEIAGVERNQAKTINLGVMYGMGVGKLSSVLGNISFEEAKAIRDEYNEKVPFIRDLASMVTKTAEKRSELRTMLGRKCRFPMRELKGYSKTMKKPIHAEALEAQWEDILNTPEKERDSKWRSKNPNLYQVAFTYKALNRLIQASSADQTKQAMLDCAAKGHVPMLTVHDELCFSVQGDEVPEIRNLMEQCVPKLNIPAKVDVGLGENWGDAK